jgi:glycosyltransferase involved in cell wall biosynthesis
MIIVDGAHLAGLRLPSGVPLVLDEHNIEYELLARHGAGERSVARRWFNQLEHLKCFREETSSWKRFDGCLFTSDREAKVMVGVAPQTKVVVVGNGVDIEYFQPHPIAVGEVRLPDPKIVFTGRMDYRPNVDAAHHLVEDVLPLVRLDHPTAQVWVVGMNPPTELTRMAARTAGVTVTGAVDDVRPYLREAAVVVAPLRMGGGTRLKILEAMAMGQAVVSTHLGCEGLDVRPDQDLLVADSPAEQAAAIAQVLSDPELASALGRSGRARVVELYGWDAVTAGLDDFVLSIVQRHRERGPNSPS